MTNTKNNLPIYAEEQIINEEQKILNKQRVIPQDFVELTSYGRSNSTEELELPKTLCWRYNFAYENGKKWITLDIPKNLMEKLGLEPGKNCSDLVFISPQVLKRDSECGGITLQNEKEIFFVSQGSKMVREKETQTKLSGEEIEKLTKKMEELETELSGAENLKNIWRNKYLEEKGSNGQEFQTQITELTTQRDNFQQRLVNRQNEINNLQNQVNQLTNQINGLNQQLNTTNILITNTQNRLGINNLNNLPLLPEGETLDSLLARPTPVDLQERQDRIGELENEVVGKDRKINQLIANKDIIQRELNQEKNNLEEMKKKRLDLNQLAEEFQRRHAEYGYSLENSDWEEVKSFIKSTQGFSISPFVFLKPWIISHKTLPDDQKTIYHIQLNTVVAIKAFLTDKIKNC